MVVLLAEAVQFLDLSEHHADAHEEDDGSASTYTGYRDVVLALDVAGPCDDVIEFAFEAARLRSARLRAVHAWRPSGALGPGPGDVTLADRPAQAEEWLGFLAAVLAPWRDKYADVPVLETVVEGRPTSAVVRAATGASLVVVGHRLDHRTGPVTHAVVERAGCPVAVVPHG